MVDRIKIGGVCERDLDLFLQEQLISSSAFCTWFTSKLGLEGINEVAESVERGQTDQTGESDITAIFQIDDGTKVAIYVENKIKATFQKEQYNRYVKRAQKAVGCGQIADYRVVLFAPQKYLNKSDLKGFDNSDCYRLSYDEVLSYFNADDADVPLSLALRSKYKATLINDAIRIAKGSHQGVAEDFWDRYWEEVNSITPEFNFPYPAGRKAAGGDTIEFTRSDLKSRDWPVKPEPCHRLVQGNFGKYGKAPYGAFYLKIPKYYEKAKFEALVAIMEPHLAAHMMIVKANPSAAIRIAVPQIRKSDWSKDQIPALRSAIYLGRDLYRWFLSEPVQSAWSELMQHHAQSQSANG